SIDRYRTLRVHADHGSRPASRVDHSITYTYVAHPRPPARSEDFGVERLGLPGAHLADDDGARLALDGEGRAADGGRLRAEEGAAEQAGEVEAAGPALLGIVVGRVGPEHRVGDRRRERLEELREVHAASSAPSLAMLARSPCSTVSIDPEARSRTTTEVRSTS